MATFKKPIPSPFDLIIKRNDAEKILYINEMHLSSKPYMLLLNGRISIYDIKLTDVLHNIRVKLWRHTASTGYKVLFFYEAKNKKTILIYNK